MRYLGWSEEQWAHACEYYLMAHTPSDGLRGPEIMKYWELNRIDQPSAKRFMGVKTSQKAKDLAHFLIAKAIIKTNWVAY